MNNNAVRSSNSHKSMLSEGRLASRRMASASQDQIDDWVAHMGWHLWQDERFKALTASCAGITGLGNSSDLLERYHRRVMGILGDLHGEKSIGLIERDEKKGLSYFAKPAGVLAITIPATSPTAAVACNTLNCLKTGNAAIFCPNPKAAPIVVPMVKILQSILQKIGLPKTLLQAIDQPDRQKMSELMDGSDLIIATGGKGVVRRASQSSTPCYTAGVGNSIILIEQSADLEQAADLILAGKSFDHGTSCSSESVVLIPNSLATTFTSLLVERGAYHCTTEEEELIASICWPKGSSGPLPYAGRSASEIAKAAQIDLNMPVRALLVTPNEPACKSIYAGEKLSPILSLFSYETVTDGFELTHGMLETCGKGHSCGIYTQNMALAQAYAASMPVGRVMVNQSTGHGNTGSTSNNMPYTMTLACGTWGGCVTAANVSWRNLQNITVLSEPCTRFTPSSEQIFGKYLEDNFSAEGAMLR